MWGLAKKLLVLFSSLQVCIAMQTNFAQEGAYFSLGEVTIGNAYRSDIKEGERHIWHFEGIGGEQIAISLTSPTFDTYLWLVDAKREEVLVYDDDSGASGSNSALEYNLPRTGNYSIVVGSLNDRGSGNYTLSLGSSIQNPPQNFVEAPARSFSFNAGSKLDDWFAAFDDRTPNGGMSGGMIGGAMSGGMMSGGMMPFDPTVPASIDDPIPSFPWPPPSPAARQVLSDEFVRSPLLADVNTKLRTALESLGYYESSYYAVPGGFALATQLEQTSSDGTSRQPPSRWEVEVESSPRFSIKAFFSALFRADAITPDTTGRAYFRVIVFVVTDRPINSRRVGVSVSEGRAWVADGADRLPQNVARYEYTDAYKTTALIYEFELPTTEEELKEPRLPARVHLEKSGLWDALGQ